MFWKRQTDPQLVPMAPDINTDIRRMLLASWLSAAMGEFRKVLQRVMLMAVKRMVKKRATLGKAWIQYETYVLRQDGSCGWSKAQDNDLIAGCAGEVIGEMEDRALGRVSKSGKRIGDVKAGHFAFEMRAKLSAMETVEGQGRWRG